MPERFRTIQIRRECELDKLVKRSLPGNFGKLGVGKGRGIDGFADQHVQQLLTKLEHRACNHRLVD